MKLSAHPILFAHCLLADLFLFTIVVGYGYSPHPYLNLASLQNDLGGLMQIYSILIVGTTCLKKQIICLVS